MLGRAPGAGSLLCKKGGKRFPAAKKDGLPIGPRDISNGKGIRGAPIIPGASDLSSPVLLPLRLCKLPILIARPDQDPRPWEATGALAFVQVLQ